jgi:hypothetical protein
MANHEICILDAHPNPGHPDKSSLRLSDNGLSVINSGDTVTWIIPEGSMISSIVVFDDNRNSNVFAPDPKPVPGSTSWMGTAKAVTSTKQETYTICWSQNGMTYCFDPKIVVNP